MVLHPVSVHSDRRNGVHVCLNSYRGESASDGASECSYCRWAVLLGVDAGAERLQTIRKLHYW